MKLLQINDAHSSAVPPQWRRESYNDEIFDKLMQVEAIAQDLSQTDDVLVAFTGDIFHNPRPDRQPSWLVKMWMTYLSVLTEHASVVILRGNHDCISASNFDRQPLALLGYLPGVQVINKPGWVYGPSVYAIPWEYEMSLSDFDKAIDQNLRPEILLIHAAVALKENPFYSVLKASDLQGAARMVCYGHLHPPEEVYTVGTTSFVNPGALSRGSLTASDLERTPQIAIIDTDDFSVEYRKLDALPASEVFRAAEAESAAIQNQAVAYFVETLGSAKLDSVTPQTIADEAARLAGGNVVVAEKAREFVLNHGR